MLIEIGPYSKERSRMILYFYIELCQLFTFQNILVMCQLENSETFQISMKEGFATHLGERLCFCLGGFASVGSDHRVVTVKLRLSPRMSKSRSSKKRYNWLLLTVDKDLCSRFTLDLRNKYSELHNEDSGATEQFAAPLKAKDHAAESVLPPTPKGKRERHSNNPIVLALRKKINQLAHCYSVNKSEAKNELEKQHIVLEKEYIASLIEETESEIKASNTAKAWKVVNTITNRKHMPLGKLKGKSPEERKKQWLTHFRNLLGTPDKHPSIENIPLTFKNNIIIEDGVLTLEELREAKKRLRFGKAQGDDGIMPELLKVVDIDDIILRISNKFYMEKQMPDQLGILNLLPSPKSGDLS